MRRPGDPLLVRPARPPRQRVRLLLRRTRRGPEVTDAEALDAARREGAAQAWAQAARYLETARDALTLIAHQARNTADAAQARTVTGDCPAGGDHESQYVEEFGTWACLRCGRQFPLNGKTAVEEPEDPEEFCPVCFAGMESSEHHEKCVVPAETAEGDPMTDDAHGYGPRHREARRRGLDTCPACRRAGITEPPTYSDEFIVARVRALVTEHPDTQVPIVALDDLRRALGDQ